MNYYLNDKQCVVYRSPSGLEVGVGSICIVEYKGNKRDLQGKFVVVQKTNESINFGGKFVFPGGMTRGATGKHCMSGSVDKLQKDSLLYRVEQEVGLNRIDGLCRILNDEPIFTKYRAAGKMRYTRLDAWYGKTTQEELVCSSSSTEKPIWLSTDEVLTLPKWATANLVYLSKYLQSKRSVTIPPGEFLSAVEKAKRICQVISAEIY